MLNKCKNKQLIKRLFVIMLAIQPLLNLNILYSDSVISFFKFSPATIIRLLMVLILFSMIFISKKVGKQEKYLLLYTVLYIIFIFLHNWNSQLFIANPSDNYKYSIFNELFYLFRMFIPVLIIYITANIKLTSNDIKKILKITVLSFSLVIIISNLLTFGIKSYGKGIITYNIFSWFGKQQGIYSDYLTIGLFIGTNRLSTLLLALLPLTVYYYLNDQNNSFIVVVILHILSLIMIGTRTATYGYIPIVVLMLLIQLYIDIFRKRQKPNVKKNLILIISLVLLIMLSLNSPIKTRNEYNDLDNAQIINENLKKTKGNKLDKLFIKYKNEFENNILCNDCEAQNEIVNFVKGNYNRLYISYEYAQIYDYNYDYLFWANLINLPFDQRSNGRKIQHLISDRLFELNNNQLRDSLFGMGYSRFKNADLYLEQDFLVQYYTSGIVGLFLFTFPYIVTLICAIVYTIKNITKKFDFEMITYCFCLCLFLICGYIGGHVLDEMLTYTFMALLCGLILKKCFYKDHSCNKEKSSSDDLISVIIPAYNVEEYLEECVESVINQKQLSCNIEIIIVNDCSKDGTLDICKKYASRDNITLINNKKNKGLAFSRNEAIKKAKGNYIMFLDSDDMLYEDAVFKLYNEISKTDSDIVMSKINSFNSKGYYGYYSDKYMNDIKNGTIYENLELINCISVCGKIYKKSLIEKIEFLNNTIHEDNSFTLIALFNSKNIAVLPEYTYYRRCREGENGSIMQNLNYHTFSDLIKNYNHALNKLNKNVPRYLKLYMIRQLNNYIIKHVDSSDFEKSKNNIKVFITNNFSKCYLIYSKLYLKFANVYKKVIYNVKKS